MCGEPWLHIFWSDIILLLCYISSKWVHLYKLWKSKNHLFSLIFWHFTWHYLCKCIYIHIYMYTHASTSVYTEMTEPKKKMYPPPTYAFLILPFLQYVTPNIQSSFYLFFATSFCNNQRSMIQITIWKCLRLCLLRFSKLLSISRRGMVAWS